MERLTAQDLSMLWPDDFGWPQDIGGWAILDGSPLLDAGGRFRIDDVWEVIEARRDGLVLRAHVPVSLHREPPGQAYGNLDGMMVVPLPIGVPDPTGRLRLPLLELFPLVPLMGPDPRGRRAVLRRAVQPHRGRGPRRLPRRRRLRRRCPGRPAITLSIGTHGGRTGVMAVMCDYRHDIQREGHRHGRPGDIERQRPIPLDFVA